MVAEAKPENDYKKLRPARDIQKPIERKQDDIAEEKKRHREDMMSGQAQRDLSTVAAQNQLASHIVRQPIRALRKPDNVPQMSKLQQSTNQTTELEVQRPQTPEE